MRAVSIRVIRRVFVRIATSRAVVEARGFYDFLLQVVENLVVEGFVEPPAQETIFPVVGVSSVDVTFLCSPENAVFAVIKACFSSIRFQPKCIQSDIAHDIGGIPACG